MKVLILMGSPHLKGNTAKLCEYFMDGAKENSIETEYITLCNKKIAPCKGCYNCQQVSHEYGCAIKDDMYIIAREIEASDIIVLATPIYTWYCTAEMKAMLDRCFGLSKFYGKGKSSLWEGKKVAIIATHGYDREYAASLFEEGIKRLCAHCALKYLGMYSVRDTDDIKSFETKEAKEGAVNFARKILKQTKDEKK